MDQYENLFNKEPVFECPCCGIQLHTDWVDNGFGTYSVQASPYGCEACGWHETGCEECIREKCFSWATCQGRALNILNIYDGPGDEYYEQLEGGTRITGEDMDRFKKLK